MNSQLPDTNLPLINGIVWVVITDGNNGWYIGGVFTQVAGETRNRVAKINSDGSLASWNPNVENGDVITITTQGNYVYLGGNFTLIGGKPFNRIARINYLTGELDTLWNPSANATVNCISINDNDIYVGGWFTEIGGLTGVRIAKLNSVNSFADTSWLPNSNGVPRGDSS